MGTRCDVHNSGTAVSSKKRVDTSLQESWRYARDARDARYAGSTRAARQRSGEGREAGEAVDVALLQEPLCLS